MYLDFGQVLSALKNKGMILETVECPNCGGKLDISQVPKKEEILQCKHCGKPILAVNVFEKFKELLDQ
jgi:NAD-dependent SIR2 family protein deacetylase